GQSSLSEDELIDDIRDLFSLLVLRAGAVRDDGNRLLVEQLDVGTVSEVLGAGQRPRNQAGEVETVVPADAAPRPDVQVGGGMQDRLAVADDSLADSRRQGPLVGVAAGPIEGDGQRWLVTVGGELQ